MMFGGKIALVAGGGSGVGRAVCRLLAERGAIVVAADVNHAAAQDTVSQLAGGGPQHLAVECDVGSGESVRQCFSTISAQLSRPPTLLANTAGITRDAFITKMTEELFDKVLQVNLKGTFLLTQAFAQILGGLGKESGSPVAGSIVTISSITAGSGNMGQCNYAASKAGVEAFTKTAAKELARQGIRINCIIPGLIDTPMTESVPSHLKDFMKQIIPLKRAGQPEEVAEAVAFLLSEQARYISGACLPVTGGLTGLV